MSNFLISPLFSVVLPFVSRKVIGFSSFQYGLLEAGWTIGMLIGSILISIKLANMDSWKMFEIGIIFQIIFSFAFNIFIFPTIVTLFGGPTWFLLSMQVMFLVFAGCFNPLVNVPISTSLQRAVPKNLMSRVFSVVALIAQMAVPVGSLIYGFLLDRVPSHIIYMVACIVMTLVSVVYILISPREVFDVKSIDIKKL